MKKSTFLSIIAMLLLVSFQFMGTIVIHNSIGVYFKPVFLLLGVLAIVRANNAYKKENGENSRKIVERKKDVLFMAASGAILAIATIYFSLENL